VGHLFPRLLGQSEYNQRLKDLAPLLEATLRWLADKTPGSAERLRLLDGTPVGCGQSTITTKRSGLFGYAGYEPAHSRYYWGVKLLLVVTADGTVTGFGLANPKLLGEREAIRQLLVHQPANRPPAGSAVVTDKGLSGEDTEAFFAGLELALIRPARKDEHDLGIFPNWLRQRVEVIIWTLKHQLGLEAHGGRVPAGLWARIVQRLLALNAAIWHNWAIGAPRSSAPWSPTITDTALTSRKFPVNDLGLSCAFVVGRDGIEPPTLGFFSRWTCCAPMRKFGVCAA
jgi:hypothetical protein